MRQGRVTLPCKSLRGVRAPNRSVRREYTMFYYTIYVLSQPPHSSGKNHRPLLVHPWKTFVMLHDLSWARPLRNLSLEPVHLFLRVLHTFGCGPSILILYAAFPCHKISKPFHWLIPPSNLLHVRNDLILDDPFYLSHSNSPSMSSGSRGGCSRAGLFEDLY